MNAGSIAVPLRRVGAAGAAGVARYRRGLTRGQKLLTAVLALIVAISTWLAIRNSSLVAVERVRVIGLSGFYDRDARRAIATEAQTMTTMNIDEGRLRDAASQFVDVARIRVDTDFPHGVTVFVAVRRPVAVAKIGAALAGITGTGLILDDSQTLAGLPRIEVNGPISHGHVTDRKALEAVTVLAAAPDVMLRQVKSVDWGKRGFSILLAKGVKIYFGGESRATAKWQAVVTVLSGSSAKGAHYIDVRIPDRPAIGGLGAAPVTPRPQPLATPATTPPPAGSTAAAGATAGTGAPVTQPAPANSTPPPVQQQAVPGAGTGAPAAGARAGTR